METIVVGYDDTPASQRALERVADLARAFESKVVVTSVAPIIASAGRSAGAIDPVEPPSEHARELEQAKAYFEGKAVQADYVRAIGQPADTLVELADRRGADLIVVGTRELGIVQRLLGQSVSESVVHKADCDVLIVH